MRTLALASLALVACADVDAVAPTPGPTCTTPPLLLGDYAGSYSLEWRCQGQYPDYGSTAPCARSSNPYLEQRSLLILALSPTSSALVFDADSDGVKAYEAPCDLGYGLQIQPGIGLANGVEFTVLGGSVGRCDAARLNISLEFREGTERALWGALASLE